MAKQTFTTGQVLTAAQMTSLQQTAMGGGSTTAKVASYVLVAADAGTVVQMNAAGATTITVNTALFAAGDSVQIQNVGAGVCTVTAGTATVNTSSTLALKQFDAGSLYFNSTSAAIFFATDAADSTSPLTTKGDLYTFSTLDARLPVGTNAQILVADSTASTGLAYKSVGVVNGLTTTGDTIYSSSGTTQSRLGIGSTGQVLTVASGVPSWATPAGGSTFVGASAFSSAQQTISSGTDTVITYNSETYDTDSIHSTASNTSRFTIPTGKSGYWLCSFTIMCIHSGGSVFAVFPQIRKNGSGMIAGAKYEYPAATATDYSFTFSIVLSLAAADFIEFMIRQNAGATRNFFSDNVLIGAGYGQISYLGA